MSNEFVDALYNGKNLEAEDAFKTAMQDKVGAALEVKRREVANNFVKTKIKLPVPAPIPKTSAAKIYVKSLVSFKTVRYQIMDIAPTSAKALTKLEPIVITTNDIIIVVNKIV